MILPREKAKILVIGADGLLGRALVQLGLQGVGRLECDLRDPLAMERCLLRHQPGSVLLCAADTRVDACERDPDSYLVNAQAPAWLAARVPLWFVSTNYVFSGPGPHAPDAPRRPLMRYGQQKARAEDAVLAAGGHVVRTGWLYGKGGRNLLSRLPALLRTGPVDLIADIPIQPTWALDLAAWLLTLPTGLNHAVGAEETTFFGFGQAIAARLALKGNARAVRMRELHLEAERPEDARLTPATLPGWSLRIGAFLEDP